MCRTWSETPKTVFLTTRLQYCFYHVCFSGLGFGLIYLPAIVTVGYYFEERRAFATGLAVCGSGLGAFIFNPFSKYLIDTYTWRGAILIEAGIILNCVLCGALFRPLVNTKKRRKSLKNKEELRQSAFKSFKDALEMELFITSDKTEEIEIVANGNISNGHGDMTSLTAGADSLMNNDTDTAVVKPKVDIPGEAPPSALFSSDGALNKWPKKRNGPMPISPLALEPKPPQFARLSSVDQPRQRHNHHQLVPGNYFIYFQYSKD